MATFRIPEDTPVNVSPALLRLYRTAGKDPGPQLEDMIRRHRLTAEIAEAPEARVVSRHSIITGAHVADVIIATVEFEDGLVTIVALATEWALALMRHGAWSSPS